MKAIRYILTGLVNFPKWFEKSPSLKDSYQEKELMVITRLSGMVREISEGEDMTSVITSTGEQITRSFYSDDQIAKITKEIENESE